jgi:hypothetical protein
MKIIILGKKKLGLNIILLGLMVILFAAANWFQDNLKYTALLQSNINSFKTYQYINNEFGYDLPSEWAANIRKVVSSEIDYQNEFISKNSDISGMIQVWISQSDLTNFINKNAVMEQNQNIIRNYTVNKLSIDNHESFVVDYSMLNSQNINFRCEEYYIKMNKGIIKYSFYVRDKDFKENMSVIFKEIVNTLKFRSV